MYRCFFTYPVVKQIIIIFLIDIIIFFFITFSILKTVWFVFCNSFSKNVSTLSLPLRYSLTYIHGPVFSAFIITITSLDQFRVQPFTIIFLYFDISTFVNFRFRIFIIVFSTKLNICTWLYINKLHFDCSMICCIIVFVNNII